jgi:L-malate glycosyltransferase
VISSAPEERSPPGPLRLLLTMSKAGGTGSTVSVRYLAHGLAERGHDVLVACPPGGGLAAGLREDGVRVVPLEFRGGWDLRAARRLAEVVREEGVQLVDAQESRDRKAAILARALFGIAVPLVITRRQESSTFILEGMLYGRAADRVVAISEGVARSLRRTGIPAEKIRVVHTGVDLRRLDVPVDAGVVESLRHRLGLARDLPTVGVVARRKDQETLLRALAILARPVNVLFVGIQRDPPLAALEGQLPAGSRVAYTGFVASVLPYYRLIDVLTLPTRAEGLSQVILEGLALRIPVVSAATGGTPEVLGGGACGLLFPPGDARQLAAGLARLLDDSVLRLRLSRAGRSTVEEHFNVSALAERAERTYLQLLGIG